MSSRCLYSLAATWAAIVAVPWARAQPLDRPVAPEARQATVGFDQAYAAGRFDEALDYALRLAELHPGLGTPEYNVACLSARTGSADQAIGWLERAIDSGYDSATRIAADADLATLRDDPRFKMLLDRAKEQSSRPVVVYLPKEFDPQASVPLVVLLHNFGGNARSAANLWKEAADRAGVILAAPKARKQINPAQWRWSEPPEAERIVLARIEELRSTYSNIAADRIALVGMGQGGDLAYGLAVKHPDLFRGMISVAGHLSQNVAESVRQTTGKKPRGYIMVGDRDREADNCRRAAETLETAGWTVKLRVFPDVGRFFPEDRTREQIDALEWVLGPSPSGKPPKGAME